MDVVKDWSAFGHGTDSSHVYIFVDLYEWRIITINNDQLNHLRDTLLWVADRLTSLKNNENNDSLEGKVVSRF